MPQKNKFENFIVNTVPLEGSNLVEASAGTGKTYSIAILVLRLLLEKKIAITEILMVTFTKAAVAELELRIRHFVHYAHECSKGNPIADSTITTLVKKSIEEDGEIETERLLKEATLFLDEISVLTIHSFCQQTLLEFAFETGQIFGAELLQDSSAILEEEVNKFWRKNITTLPGELLEFIYPALVKKNANPRDAIKQLVKEHLSGKRYHAYQKSNNGTISQKEIQPLTNRLKEIKQKEILLNNNLVQFIKDNNQALKDTANSNQNAKKHVLNLIDFPEEFIDSIKSKRNSKYISELFQNILDKCDECQAVKDEQNQSIGSIISNLYCVAISEITDGIKKHKMLHNQMSFDDLIDNLHAALTADAGKVLAKALQKKYKAAFIDEFQDTDRKQYEIFERAFGSGTILFYIGDPKQSIYAWRTADIFTYFKASDAVKHRYQMNQNYRSSENYIDAMNLFFVPEKDFDTFYYKDESYSIDYTPVLAPASPISAELLINSKPCTPITINEYENKEDIALAVAKQIADLLSNTNYRITKEQRNIIPSDIGVLVRNKDEGHTIKEQLYKLGIPSVDITTDKILQSGEAKAVLYILTAIADNSNKNINRALLSGITGFQPEDIIRLNSEKASASFKKYKTTWDKDGVYAAMLEFMSDFDLANKFSRNTNGDRMKTNFYHVIELIHKTQQTKNISEIELINWLKHGIEQENHEDDEYEMRIENDEEAVKIVTIHSSKGLEYNIVMAPTLDLKIKKQLSYYSFRNPESAEYISVEDSNMTEEYESWYSKQTEQENRRLLYVTITRAVYKCFIYKNNSSFNKESTLTAFTDVLKTVSTPLIEFNNKPLIADNYIYKGQQVEVEPVIPKVDFQLLHKNWRKLSYTGLAADLDKIPKKREYHFTTDYDQFIFQTLAPGNKTGNLLHYIFENLHFTNEPQWPYVIDKAMKRFYQIAPEENKEMLLQMVRHVMTANIETPKGNFQLADIDFNKRLHELEFNFPVIPFQPTEIMELYDSQNILIHLKKFPETEGLMNGIIDMIFEHNGLYYILDWKSTYLGGTLEHYQQAGLFQAMNENNYHLQYLIYTLALKKYLNSRLESFDYEKHFGGVLYAFVRGMRTGNTSGVIYFNPPIEIITKLEQMLGKFENALM